jgi:hypothetical protein
MIVVEQNLELSAITCGVIDPYSCTMKYERPRSLRLLALCTSGSVPDEI